MQERKPQKPLPTGVERFPGFAPSSRDWVAAALMLASLFLFFAPVIFAGEVFYFRDVCMEIVPKRWFLSRSGGEVLWNPYGFFGLPLAANSQWAAFYPFNFFFLLGSAARSVSFYIIFHYVVALSGAYVLMRSLGRSWAAALAGALAFAYGGFFISAGVQVVVLSSAAWIMWLLWSVRQGIRTGRAVFVAGVGIFWALQVMGGEPEIAFLTAIIVALFCAALYLEKEEELSGRAYLTRCLYICGAGLVLAAALSAVQWSLSLDMAGLSNRAGGVDYQAALKWSLPPGSLFTLLFPNNILDPSQGRLWVLGFFNLEAKLPYLLSVYPGIVVLLLAGVGIVKDRKTGAILAGGAALFLLLSLGDYGLLYRLFYHLVPGFDRFRIPEKCLYGFAVLLSLLCAAGTDKIVSGAASKDETDQDHGSGGVLRRALPFLLLAAGIIAVLRSYFLEAGQAPSVASGPEALQQYHLDLISASIIQSAGVVALFLAVFFLARLRFLKRTVAAFMICLIILMDLFLAHQYVNPATEPGFYSLKNNIAEGVPQGDRVAVFSPDKPDRWLGTGDNVEEFFKNQRQWVQPFTGLQLKLRDTGAKSSFYPADADRWLSLLRENSQSEKERILALSGVKWVIRPGAPPYKIKDALPRAYVTPQVEFVQNREKALQRIQSESFDPRETAVLEGEPPSYRMPGAGPVFWGASILEEKNHYLAIMVESDHPGYLVLLDSFMPGWHARMNGEELPLYRANGFFRAVPVDKSGGVVEFYYRPLSFYAGLAVSLVGLALCMYLLFRRRPRLLWWPLWFLVLAVLPAMHGGTHYVPVTALKSTVLLMAAAWAYKLMRERELAFLRTRLDLVVALFWLVAAYAFVKSDYFYISLYWHLNIVTCIILFYVLVQFAGEEGRREKRGDGIMALVVFSGLVQSAWAVSQYLAEGDRGAGGFYNPALLAGYLMAISPYVLARSLRALQKPGKRGVVLFGGGALVFLVLAAGALVTRSRALIIWPVPLLLVAVPGLQGVLESRGMSPRRSFRAGAAAAGTALVLGAVLLAVFPNPLRERVLNIESDKYAFERPEIWASSLKMIKEHPLGVGLGMYKYYSHRYKFPVENVIGGRYERTADSAHNEYLHLAAEMSVLAPVLLLLALVLLLMGAVRKGRRSGRGPVITGLAAGILSLALHAFFDSNLHNPSLAVLAAVFSALLVCELAGLWEGWTVPVDPGGWARRGLFLVLLLAVLLGTPAYLALARGFGRNLEARKATDLRKAVFLAHRAGRHSLGNALPFRSLAGYLLAEYQASNNIKHLEKAWKAAKEAVDRNPADPAARGMEARTCFLMYRNTGHGPLLEEALEKIEKALELAPSNVDYHLLAAEAYKVAENRGEQLGHLRKALELEPHDLGARLRLVKALYQADRRREAEEQWEEFHRRRREVKKAEEKDSRAFATPYRQRRSDYDRNLYQALSRMQGGPEPAAD
ncbi:MAG: O-antigen ligase family protein [bacterium]